MYSRAGPIVAGMRQALPVITESLSKNAAFQFPVAPSGPAQIVLINRLIIESNVRASASMPAPQQQTREKWGFRFRSSETNFNYLIRRINYYLAARQIVLSDTINFANVP